LKQELKNALFKYVINHKIYYLQEQEKDFLEMKEFFNNGILCFDRPDGFCKNKDSILMIEHFEFDSSNNSRRGSKNRQEEARVLRRMYNTNDDTTIRDEITCKYTVNNYIENAKKFFDAHYENIKEYREHLENESIINSTTKQVKTLFCIEDVTLLGNFDINKNKPIILLDCEDFIEHIKQCLKLDYILCFSSFGCETYTWFASLKHILEYKNFAYKKDELNITDFQPQISSISIRID